MQPLTAPVLRVEPRAWGVEMFWDPVPGATSYEIWLVYHPSERVKRRQVGAGTHRYALSDEIGSALYNFRVRALRDTADGRDSECSPTEVQGSL